MSELKRHAFHAALGISVVLATYLWGWTYVFYFLIIAPMLGTAIQMLLKRIRIRSVEIAPVDDNLTIPLICGFVLSLFI